MRWSVGFAAVLGAGACSPTLVVNSLASSEGFAVTRAVAYAEGPRHTLDIYRPNNAAATPVVVFFYGGSWQSGDKESYFFVASALARRGYLTLVPDYRVYPQTRYPGFIEDGARAVRWAKDNAGRLGGDPNKIFVMGHSAGAYIAAMLAIDDRWLNAVDLAPRRDIAGLIGLAGPSDFLPIKEQTIQDIFGGATPVATQPITYVSGHEPPAFLATATNDDTVNPGNSARLARRLKAAGDDVQLVRYPGGGHLGIIGAYSGTLRFVAPVVKDVDNFIARISAARASSNAGSASPAARAKSSTLWIGAGPRAAPG